LSHASEFAVGGAPIKGHARGAIGRDREDHRGTVPLGPGGAVAP